MIEYVNRGGLFVPAASKLEAFRTKYGIPIPNKEDEQRALQELKDSIGNAIIAESKKVEHLFGGVQQGAGALQATMVAAIDAAAEGLAAYNGKHSAVSLLQAVADRIANGTA